MNHKLYLPILLIFAFFTEGVSAQQTANSRPKVTAKGIPIVKRSAPKPTPVAVKMAKIQFEKDKFDFGTVKEDAIIERVFEFTNVGEKELVIINADVTCGCTVPTIPLQPISVGGKGNIHVKYTAKNKSGPQKPVITVTTNGTPAVVKLQLEGWVEQVPGGIK